MVRWIVLLALSISAVGACTLFDEDPPDDSCKTDTDCFRAQGEACNLQTHRCEMRTVDAGVDTP
jgi:hypothetical protein